MVFRCPNIQAYSGTLLYVVQPVLHVYSDDERFRPTIPIALPSAIGLT